MEQRRFRRAFKAAAGSAFPVTLHVGHGYAKVRWQKWCAIPSRHPICLVPALVLDVGVIHVHRADQHGNAQIDGITGVAGEMARACKTLIVSAEEIVDCEEFRCHPDRTIIPYYLVDAVVHAPFGSHPGEMCYRYRRDEPQIKEWVKASEEPQTTQAYLNKYIYNLKNHQEYLAMIGEERLNSLRQGVDDEEPGPCP
jgi:hypothetical protein